MKRLIAWLGTSRGALAVLLVVSLILRLVIVFRGGQSFWGDETRYGAATGAWDAWSHGHRHEALLLIAGTADHLGFKVIMLLPAWLQIHTRSSTVIPACFIALFSVANIFWVWLLARRMGADEREALWSSATMAAAASMFYWARHLMPYDLAMFWALGCAYVAFKRQPGMLDSWLAGILGFGAFVTYNGAWSVVACVMTAHVLLGLPRWKDVLKRACLGLLGLAGTFTLMLFLAVHFGIYLLDSYLDFSDSIKQGDFGDGYVVVFDYLWRTEHLLALVWAVALLAFGWLAWRCTGAEARKRGVVWSAIIVALIGILIGGSNFLEKFVVYGRLVRQVVPFCALLTGWTAVQLFRVMPPWRAWERVALAGVIASGAWSMRTPLAQEFPVSFYERAARMLHAYHDQHVQEDPEGVKPDKFRFRYIGFIWPYPNEAPLPAHYLTLLAAPHPLAWRPYLYEGFSRDQRGRFDATDITMRLILLKE